MKGENLSEIFDQVKEKLLIDWANFYMEQSYQQAFTFFDNASISNSNELKKLIPILEGMEFEEFKAGLENWLNKGRSTWYISGNIDDKQAIDLVEGVRNTLKLDKVSIKDIADVKPVAL